MMKFLNWILQIASNDHIVYQYKPRRLKKQRYVQVYLSMDGHLSIILLYILALQQKFMLENNHLYRRIQHKNLFRTFSRTYSRQTPTRKLLSETKSHITDQTIYSTSVPFIHGNNPQFLTHKTLKPQENSTQRLQLTAQTAAIFHRSEGFNHIENPYQSTINITTLEPKHSKLQKLGPNSNLHSLLQERKQSISSITHLSQRKQNFKLKSCSQALQINYQSQIDEADFSILEYNKRFQIKKESLQKQRRQMQTQSKIGILKYRFKQVPYSQMKAKVGKRITPQLLTKFKQTSEGFSYLKKNELAQRSIENS